MPSRAPCVLQEAQQVGEAHKKAAEQLEAALQERGQFLTQALAERDEAVTARDAALSAKVEAEAAVKLAQVCPCVAPWTCGTADMFRTQHVTFCGTTRCGVRRRELLLLYLWYMQMHATCNCRPGCSLIESVCELESVCEPDIQPCAVEMRPRRDILAVMHGQAGHHCACQAQLQ